MKLSLKNLDNVTYFELNNEINRPVDDQIPLYKDKEALAAFFNENVEPYTKKFESVQAKLDFLIEEDYIESEFIAKYSTQLSNLYISI